MNIITGSNFSTIFFLCCCGGFLIQSEALKQCVHEDKCVNLGLCGCELSHVLNGDQELTDEQAQELTQNVCDLDLNSSSEFKVKVCCECSLPPADDLSQVTTETPQTLPPRVSLQLGPAKCKNFTNENIDILPTDCGISQSYEDLIRPRIIRGNITEYYKLPWMVLLVDFNLENNTWRMSCGGTIIAKNYVLTAAHCVNLTPPALPTSVLIGLNDIILDTYYIDENIIPVKQRFIHPEYNPFSLKNDIALLRLEYDIPSDNIAVKPICLPVNERFCTNFETSKLIVSGWGTTETDNISNQLRHAQVPFVNIKRCIEIYKTTSVKIFKSNICAGGEIADICTGDSGGPLQMVIHKEQEKDDIYIQYGVVSKGLPGVCGRKGYPGVFTNIKPFLGWIINTMAQKD